MTIQTLLQNQRAFYHTGLTRSLDFRLAALKRLYEAIERNEKDISRALAQDLAKSATESYMTEIGLVLEEIRFQCKHLREWASCKKAPASVAQFPAKNFVMAEPYGVVLIMAPWNYPFQLCLMPLVGALAAGNCCIVKPSAYAPNVSKAVDELIADCFPPCHVAVVQGGRQKNQELLDQRFDYIFFTGGVEVGKLVLIKAAQYITPVTLELGGKSPCIVDKTADIKLAAKRVAFGKFLNAGQTCVAPDYVLIHEERMESFIRYLKLYIKRFFGKSPLTCKEYPRIVNEKHFHRLLGLMEDGRIAVGGGYDEESLMIEPTVITHINGRSPIMQEEIFGPLLPVIPFSTVGGAIRFVKRREKPLALYLFTKDKAVEQRVLGQVSFGGGCVNDTIMHLTTPHLAFGGVGMSGMGAYHGKSSFDTFTHYKSIVRKSKRFDAPLRYHPYTWWKKECIRQFLK